MAEGRYPAKFWEEYGDPSEGYPSGVIGGESWRGRLQTCRVLGIDLLNSSSSSEDIANEVGTLLTPML